MAMLESEPSLSLDALNRLSQVWVEGDYQKRIHSEIATAPLTRFLDAPSVSREAPDMPTLRRAFRQRGTRRQRRSDGTLSLEGRRFEVPGRFVHLDRLRLAWARWNLAEVDLIDPDTGAVIARVHPLDRQANASGLRRRRAPDGNADPADSVALLAAGDAGVRGATRAPLLTKLLREFVETGLPPGYLPSPEPRKTPTDTEGECS